MVPLQSPTYVQTNNLGQVRKATITASAKIFDMFSSQIYADKFSAIIREIACNARDANISAGKPDTPIEIKLPTTFTPFISFRDNGESMSREFMMDDFMSYTHSTKVKDNSVTGMFGCGSKSPLSYTDQFAIKTFQKGILRIYSIFKDADGCPSIAFLSEQATDQPDGTEISMPIDAKDIENFRDAVTCLQYFDPLPTIINRDQPLFAPEYTVKHDTWGFRKELGKSNVIQAGVAYPIDPDSLPRDVRDVLDFSIDFFVPTGSCNVSLSREALSYDEATIKVLVDTINGIKDDLAKHVSEAYENCATLWGAKAMYELDQKGASSNRRKLIQDHASYKGVKLTASFNPKQDMVDKITMAQITSNKYNRSNYGYWTEGTASPTTRAWLVPIHPKDVNIILIDDKPTKPVLRMRNWLENNDIHTKGVVIMRPNALSVITKQEWLDLMDYLGNPPFKWLSEIEPAVIVRTPGSTTSRLEAVRAYVTSGVTTVPYRNSKFETVLPASGYYMLMDNFKPLAGQATDEQRTASGLLPSELFWFNKSDANAIKDLPNWKPAIDKYKETVSTYKSTHKNLALASAMGMLFNQPRIGYYFNQLLKSDFKVPSRGSLSKIYKLFKLVEDQLNYSNETMRKLIGVKFDTQYKMLTKLFNEVQNDYPELFIVLTNNGCHTTHTTVYNKLVK